MARTPLLRAFRQLAEEHRAAERLGIPPAELRGAREEQALSRREFLTRAGALGAALTVAPGLLASRARAAAAPRIAIVGGGIAGLNAALTLADKGIAATVYEASGRVGGRMHSDTGYFANGQVAEFCGELIDSGHTTIRHLAQRFGLPTVDLLAAEPNGSEDTYWFLGGYYAKDQADKDFQPIHNTLQGQVQATSYPTTYFVHTDAGIAFDEMTVYDWIERYVDGGHKSRMGRLLDAAYNIEYGAETKGQAALNLMYLLGYGASPGNFLIYGKSDERYHIAGGNERLPEAIAEYLGPQAVKPGWSMQSIRRNADGTVAMSFTTPGKPTVVTADHVILALPFAVLRTLDYAGANFDPLKKTAITQLGAGKNGKLQLQFTTRHWNELGSNGNLYTDLGLQSGWDVTRAQDGSTGIIVDYSGGNVSAALKPPAPYSHWGDNTQIATYAKATLGRLETIFPGITPLWNGRASLSTPFLDPNLNLAYSYWKPGQYVGFSGWEGLAQGNIHFAGEHCSQDFQGYMEGGASEGARAAGEILAALK